MNVYYITFALFPAKSAHTLHMMKLCEAFAENGHNVFLIIPNHKDRRFKKDIETGVTNLYVFYNVKMNFKIIEISLFPYRGWKYLFPYMALKHISDFNNSVVYTRHTEIATVSALAGIKIFIEYHHANINGKQIQKFYSKILYKISKLQKIVLISYALKDAFIQKGFNGNKLIVIPDASSIPNTEEFIRFNQSPNQLSVGYVGSLYIGKGMEIITQIANKLPYAIFHIIGGIESDIEKWREIAVKKNLDNILFHDFVKQGDLSKYINSLQICLLPNQKNVSFLGNRHINISDYTSPLKMFDYMAHGKPIIASNLPVLREVLNDTNAVFCDPENVEEWVDAINMLANNPQLREKLGKKAFEDFKENYTWKIRAERILNSLK